MIPSSTGPKGPTGSLALSASFSDVSCQVLIAADRDLMRLPPQNPHGSIPTRINQSVAKRTRQSGAASDDSSKRACRSGGQSYASSQDEDSTFDLNNTYATLKHPSGASTPTISGEHEDAEPSELPSLVIDLSCGESDIFSDGASNDVDDEALSFSQAHSSRRLTPVPVSAVAAAPRPPLPRAHRRPTPTPAFTLPPINPDLTAMMGVICSAEKSVPIDPLYLTTRHSKSTVPSGAIDASMRATVVSWLSEVGQEFLLVQDTVHLATALLDRFLSSTRGVPRSQLQLVAVTCLLVAAKHEEESAPSIGNLAHVSDYCFTPKDLLRMESILLSCLGFSVTCPTSHTFLSLLKGMLTLQPAVHSLASYLIELAMLDYGMLDLKPSEVASGAVALAAIAYNDARALRSLPLVLPGAAESTVPCMHRLLALQRQAASVSENDPASPYLPIRDKFSSAEWHYAALQQPCSRLGPQLAAVCQK